MTGSQALDSFLEKWRARWPEWDVAEVFVPPAQRARAVVWFALLQEFDDILNVQGDPLPADAKLGWWATELRDWQAHRSRHPLGRLLEPVEAPWASLADTLPALVAARACAGEDEAAMATLSGYAAAAAAVEAALWEAAPAAPRALAAQVLAARLAASARSPQPGPDGAEAPGQRARRLLAAWPGRAGGALPRRVWSALARQRLRALAAGRVRPPERRPLSTLWRAWRAARDRA